MLVAASGLDSPWAFAFPTVGWKALPGIELESPATLSTLLCFGLDCPWCLTVPMMLNLTRAGKFGSLSNYCFVPAMPMEPPAKKRRYLKGMGLAEADREQSPRGPPKSFGWWALSARRVRHFMPVACELAKSHAWECLWKP